MRATRTAALVAMLIGTAGGSAHAQSLLGEPPVASFAAVPAPPGEPTRFDATASSDPDGPIVRYDWDFGDGTTLINGGSQPSHTYSDAGTHTVALTVHDEPWLELPTVGGSALLVGSTDRAERRVTISAAPRPDRFESVTVAAARGRVRVRVPGAGGFVPVETVTEIPLGSVVDARRGRARLKTEAARRRIERATFYAGRFVVRQDRRVMTARLRGAVACPRAGQAVVSAKRKRRSLWGRGKGGFRTRGRNSSATVRGTWWLVRDTCAGTLTRVRRGRVSVRDFGARRKFTLRPGERHLARPR